MSARVIHGDNLQVLEELAEDRTVAGHVSLVYMDPPFGTGRNFGAYDDRWDGGRRELVESLRLRLLLLRELLADDGSILVHLDHRVAHTIAVLLDELFGAGDRDPRAGSPAPGFRNELIWVYGLGGSSKNFYPRKHDTILWYTKGSSWTFHPPQIPARSIRLAGKMKKKLDVHMGPPRLDDVTTPFDERDPIVHSDVWDVASINNMAKERTGYPTQKPLALLEPLIAAHSNPGDLVLDPYCGSGTTIVAANNLRRRALGIDCNADAVALARRRTGCS